ncbi:macro domain-containing protein [Epibacterium sp. DP7N7-1]|nr:macro domain-containing protein [Epibacterium sp. DP7N7-1]
MLSYSPNLAIQTSSADILVNTVNTVGVMGKGLALDMKNAFPTILTPYKEACRSGKLQPGTFQMLRANDRQFVINLATKQGWRDPSRYEWVGVGLVYMNHYLEAQKDRFSSLAMSMPGCGNGGLEADRVQQMMRIYLHGAMEAGVRVEVSFEELAPLMDQPFFAGVGARATPKDVLTLMAEIGGLMAEADIRLRSGGAIGADSAFWEGAREVDPAGMEIFLPNAKRHIPEGILHMSPVFERLAKNFHPKPERITPDPKNPNDKRAFVLKLMARNGNQIFGTDFRNPSNAVICWTEGGRGQGGTGQAIRLANSVGIPVIDLGRPDLAGISAVDVRDMALEKIAQFRQSRGLPRLCRDIAPALA